MKRALELIRPIVFFDCESTGLDAASDRIIEISMVKMHPENVAKEDELYTRRIHPGQPIPPGSTAVHGITDQDVEDAPRFAGQIAVEISDFIAGCDFAGFGVRGYDIPLLSAELTRAGIPFDFSACAVIDARDIFFKIEPRTLAAAHLKYVGVPLEGAHGAEADTVASVSVLLGMLEQHEDLPVDVAALSKVGTDPDAYDADGKLKWVSGELVVNFGKMRGKTLKELTQVDRGYLLWMTRGSFSAQVIGCVAEALRGRFPVRAVETP